MSFDPSIEYLARIAIALERIATQLEHPLPYHSPSLPVTPQRFREYPMTPHIVECSNEL